MGLNLSWIDDFMALAATGNFSRAAEERHMTQPAFGRRIRALEEWLGTDLFDRSSQPARLTEAGQWFRGAAQDLQVQVARIPGEARAVAEANSTTLRFAATHALSFTFMPRWLQALEAHAAFGRVQLASDVHQKCEALLQQSQVQFMLAHAHPEVRSVLSGTAFESIVVGRDRLIPLSAPDAEGRPMHPLAAAVDGHQVDVLGYSDESGIGGLFQALRGAALDRLRVRTAFTAHLASVLRTMALGGRGVAWLPEILAAEDIASGRLVLAAQSDWIIELEIRLYREAVELRGAAEAFWGVVSRRSE